MLCVFFQHFFEEGPWNLGHCFLPCQDPFYFLKNKNMNDIKLYVSHVFLTDNFDDLILEYLSNCLQG